MLPAAQSLAVSADTVIMMGRGLFRGWSVEETSGSGAGGFRAYDGAALTYKSKLLASVPLGQGLADTKMPTGPGVFVEQGINIDVIGTSTVTVYFSPETRLLNWLGVFDDDTRDVDRIGFYRLLASIGEM